jgi:copper(I)-binding protein
MLFNPKQPLKVGDKLPLVLAVQPSSGAAATLRIEAEVRAAAKAAPGHVH